MPSMTSRGALVAMVSLFGWQTSWAAPLIESTDAGDTLQTARPVPSTIGFNGISGSLSANDWADVYLITVQGNLTVIGAGSTQDACLGLGGSSSPQLRLWLFDANGFGLLGSQSNLCLHPPATDGSVIATVSPGMYYLAVTHQSRAPANENGLIFNLTSPNEISGPDGPGGADPLSQFVQVSPGVSAGNYTLMVLQPLTGAVVCGFCCVPGPGWLQSGCCANGPARSGLILSLDTMDDGRLDGQPDRSLHLYGLMRFGASEPQIQHAVMVRPGQAVIIKQGYGHAGPMAASTWDAQQAPFDPALAIVAADLFMEIGLDGGSSFFYNRQPLHLQTKAACFWAGSIWNQTSPTPIPLYTTPDDDGSNPVATLLSARLDHFTSLASGCLADFNRDHKVDGVDLGALLANWSMPGDDPCLPELGFGAICLYGLNGDGFINGIDLGTTLSRWGDCFP